MSADQSSQKACVVWGGYGYGNTGDDLVLEVALADLRQQFGGNIQILSPAPDQTRLYVRDLPVCLHPSGRSQHAVGKWFWRLTEVAERRGIVSFANRLYKVALKRPEWISKEPAWLKALASASQFHLAGGGYLTDRFHLRHFLRPIRLARSRGLPITTSPLGLGPFRDPKNAVAVANSLRSASLIVRDEDSLRYCQAQGLRAIEKPDDGFRWGHIGNTVPSPSSSAKTIGICIFSQYSNEWTDGIESWWIDCLQSLSRAFPDYRLEGFCFHTEKKMDYETTRRLFVRANLNPDDVQPPQPDFRAAIASLARYRAILSSRFHAVVTGSAIRIPCVATALDSYYEAKMRAALKYAPVPVAILNPARDKAQATAEWFANQLHSTSQTADLHTSSG